MRSSLFCLLLAAFFLSSCATIFYGSREQFYFSSQPPGAEVTINGRSIGQTPVVVKRKKKLFKEVVTMQKDGYEAETFRLQKRPGIVAALSMGAIPVDLISGAAMRYRNTFYIKKLTPEDSLTPPYIPNIYFDPYVITSNKDTIFITPTPKYNRSTFGKEFLKWVAGKEHVYIDAKTGEARAIAGVKELRMPDILVDRLVYIHMGKVCHEFLTYEYDVMVPAHGKTKTETRYPLVNRIADYGDYKLLLHLDVTTSSNGKTVTREKTINFFVFKKDGEFVAEIGKDNYPAILEKHFGDNEVLMKMVAKHKKWQAFQRNFYSTDLEDVSVESILDNRKALLRKNKNPSPTALH